MTKFAKKILIISALIILFFISLFIWKTNTIEKEEILTVSMPENIVAITTILEAVELTSQKDFKMIGTTMYMGSGFEPGFYFKLNLAGNKFGLDLTTQNGQDGNGGKYMGYISLTSQSTSSKTFEGKVLDISDKIQDIKLEIINKKCVEASGDKKDLAVKIRVGNKIDFEKLIGCAELKV